MNLVYHSTRNSEETATASEAILKGLTSDGGLFVPDSIPKLNVALEDLTKMSYQEIAYAVMKEFLTDFTEEEFAIARRFLDILSPQEREKAIHMGAKMQGISEEEFAKRPLVTRVEPVDERSMENSIQHLQM